MKILHVSGARGWGGNEQQLIDLIPELESLNVSNIVFGVEGSPLEGECQKRKIPFIECKEKKLNKFSNYKFLKQLVKEQKPDVIHLHTSDSLTVYTISDLLYSLKTPTVFSKKGMGGSSSVLSKLKYNYKNLNVVICVSEKVKKDFSVILSKKNREKLVVIYDGISVKRINEPNYNLIEKLTINNKNTIIGNIANHVRAKDLPVLIETMNELVNVHTQKNIHLVQIGSFNDKITPEIKNKMNQYNLNDYITLVGFVDDASSFISQFDIYVMSSEREGLPLTIYEAFYKKIPVVSTKAGGIPEVIKDGENGFLAEVKDYKTLAEKIETLSFDEELKTKFSQKSYDLFMEKYTSKHCAEKTLQLYKDITK